jgi:hypothetical protein
MPRLTALPVLRHVGGLPPARTAAEFAGAVLFIAAVAVVLEILDTRRPTLGQMSAFEQAHPELKQ